MTLRRVLIFTVVFAQVQETFVRFLAQTLINMQ